MLQFLRKGHLLPACLRLRLNFTTDVFHLRNQITFSGANSHPPMTRYLFYPHVTAYGGIERLIEALIREGRKGDEKWVLLCFSETGTKPDCLADSIPIETITTPRNFFRESKALRSWIKENLPAMSSLLAFELRAALYLSISSPPGYHLLICDTPRLLARDISKHAFSFPAPMTGANGEEVRFSARLKAEATHRLIRRGVKRAATIQTNTRALKNEIDSLYGVSSEVNYPGCSQMEDAPPLSRTRNTPGEIGFLSVCRLEPSKRIDQLIEAFSAAAERLSFSVSLTLVGNGSEKSRLESLAAETPSSNQISFTGFVTDSELEEIYREADVFVMPAVQGYGLPGLESIDRGLSLIVHSDSGVAEILVGSSRIRIITGSKDSLTEAIIELALLHHEKSDLPPHGIDIPTDASWFERATKIMTPPPVTEPSQPASISGA